MSTALANPTEMIRNGAPRCIHNDDELREYTVALFDLTAKSETTADEDEAIELLTLLIERYEAERYPMEGASQADVLRLLIDHNHLSQKDLVPQLGSEATVSLILSGARGMSVKHIQRVSERFGVSPAAFF